MAGHQITAVALPLRARFKYDFVDYGSSGGELAEGAPFEEVVIEANQSWSVPEGAVLIEVTPF